MTRLRGGSTCARAGRRAKCWSARWTHQVASTSTTHFMPSNAPLGGARPRCFFIWSVYLFMHIWWWVGVGVGGWGGRSTLAVTARP
eukprot:scaffold5209_cov106-Isochrysis_galbana.AAC.8